MCLETKIVTSTNEVICLSVFQQHNPKSDSYIYGPKTKPWGTNTKDIVSMKQV